MRLGRKKKRETQPENPPEIIDLTLCDLKQKYWCVPLIDSGSGIVSRGDAFIGTGETGEVIIAGFELPEPWRDFENVYTAYAAFLEQPGSGDRVRIDMSRISEANWAAVKVVGKPLSSYSTICICPVADGLCGSSILLGTRS